MASGIILIASYCYIDNLIFMSYLIDSEFIASFIPTPKRPPSSKFNTMLQ